MICTANRCKSGKLPCKRKECGWSPLLSSSSTAAASDEAADQPPVDLFAFVLYAATAGMAIGLVALFFILNWPVLSALMVGA